MRRSASLEEAFGGFAERPVATNDDDGFNTRLQRHTRLRRRVAGRFGFVDLIFDAGGVELLFDGGPEASRFRGSVVDDDECKSHGLHR